MKAYYLIEGQSGQRAKASSLKSAKRIGRQMARANVGTSSNMMLSGTVLPAPRLYWQTWDDGSIIGDVYRYTGDNPFVLITKVTKAS